MKILVIEDDTVVREEVVDWLIFEGHDVFSGMSGREGLALAVDILPDLILSDITMPEMDGLEMLAELRNNATTAHTPIIFMTARSARSDVRRGMELGAADYISKPFSNSELLGAVNTQLSNVEARRVQKKRQDEEWRAVLTRSLPHELRTPLTVIMGYGESLKTSADTLPPDRIRSMAQHIIDSGARLERLVDNFLTFAQLESLRHNPGRVAALVQAACTEEPDALIGDIAARCAYVYRRSGDLELHLNAGAGVRITAEELAKSVQELLDNAFKFSPPATPVRVTSAVDGGVYRLEIANVGPGIAPDELERIGAFLQFERSTREQQGLGLGMAIAKATAELFGGTLQVASELDGETVVTLALPSAD